VHEVKAVDFGLATLREETATNVTAQPAGRTARATSSSDLTET
jgi:hypothetical protein